MLINFMFFFLILQWVSLWLIWLRGLNRWSEGRWNFVLKAHLICKLQSEFSGFRAYAECRGLFLAHLKYNFHLARSITLLNLKDIVWIWVLCFLQLKLVHLFFIPWLMFKCGWTGMSVCSLDLKSEGFLCLVFDVKRCEFFKRWFLDWRVKLLCDLFLSWGLKLKAILASLFLKLHLKPSQHLVLLPYIPNFSLLKVIWILDNFCFRSFILFSWWWKCGGWLLINIFLQWLVES